jgi:hypothetical protein
MSLKELVFSRSVVEFAAVAREYCAFIENSSQYKRSQFIKIASSLLPLLYYKASMLPQTEPVYDEGNQKHVTEEYYHALNTRLKSYFGQFDAFPEVFDARISETDEGFSANLSEYLTDIYQDLKDFTMLYQKGQIEEMNDALWECTSTFREFWGIRLANAIRPIHQLVYGEIDIDEEVELNDNQNSEIDTSNWFVTQRQNDLDNEV